MTEDIPVIRLLAERRPDVLALAEAVSPAVYVEPALLRMARYTLLPQVGSEAEADLWLGPLATPTRRGLVLTVPALSSLRARLATDPARFSAAANLVRRAHAKAAPSVQLEEEIIRLSLLDSPDSVLDDRLAAVAAAMVQQPNRATDIARWLMLALPRLPERARRSPAAWALSMRAAEQLGSPSPLREPPARDLGRWRGFASVPQQGGSPTAVHLLDDGLQITAAKSQGPTVTVPPTSPRILEVGVPGARMTPVSFNEGGQRHVPVSTLQLWSGTAGDLRLSWPDRITAVAAAAGGQLVAVGFSTGRVELRNAQTGELSQRSELGSPITGLAMAGTWILIATPTGVTVSDPEGGLQPALLHSGPVAALAAPASGSYVVVAAGTMVTVYELPSGDQMGTSEFPGTVAAVATPGELIALLVADSVFVTDPALRRIRELEGVRGVRMAALSDYQLAVLGADGQVRGWQPATGQSLGIVARGAGPVVDVAASGGALVTAGTDRLLRRWAGRDLAQDSGRQRYEGKLHALTGAASADLAVGTSRGGPLTLRSLAGEAWRLEPVAADDGALGALADGEGTRFAVFSSVATAVEVCLLGGEGERRVALDSTGGGIWQGYLPGVRPGQRYGYRVQGPHDPSRGLWCDPAVLLLDPYATAIAGRGRQAGTGPAVLESVVTDNGFDWGSDSPPRTPLERTVIYEAHVKGLSQTHPDISPQIRGSYAAVAHPAMIDHYGRLGISAVLLLPVQQFAHGERLLQAGLSNYWGYNTIGFFAPHDEYSSAGIHGEQVAEFKSMVRSLHAAGIEVYITVDYNHTAEGGSSGPHLSFRGLDNLEYYATVPNSPGQYMDYTGTGNSLNMASPRVLQLIMDSLRYWVTDMHVDGFRFNLTSSLARELLDADRLSEFFGLIRQDPVLSQVKLIGEPWDVGPGGYQAGKFPPLWIELNSRYRDTVRDLWRGTTIGPEFASRMSGSADLYDATGQTPAMSVNFVTAHDGFTLADLVSYNEKHNEANGEDNLDGSNDNRSWNCGIEGPTDDAGIVKVRERQQRNFLATLLLSRGIPMLLAGDELGRTQRGNNNAYSQDNEISWLDWAGFTPGRLYELIGQLIRIRLEYPALRRGRPAFAVASPAEQGIVWLDQRGTPLGGMNWDPGMTAMAIYVRGEPPRAPDESPRHLLVLLNPSPESATFTLPGAEFADAWTVLTDTGWAGDLHLPELHATASLTVEERSLVLLASEATASGAPQATSASVPESAAGPAPEPGVAETEYAVEEDWGSNGGSEFEGIRLA